MSVLSDEELRDAAALAALGTVLGHTYDDTFKDAVHTAYRIGSVMVEERRRLEQHEADQKEEEKTAKKNADKNGETAKKK